MTPSRWKQIEELYQAALDVSRASGSRFWRGPILRFAGKWNRCWRNQAETVVWPDRRGKARRVSSDRPSRKLPLAFNSGRTRSKGH